MFQHHPYPPEVIITRLILPCPFFLYFAVVEPLEAAIPSMREEKTWFLSPSIFSHFIFQTGL